MPIQQVRFARTSSSPSMEAPTPPKRRDSLPRPCRPVRPIIKNEALSSTMGVPLVSPAVHVHESDCHDFLHRRAASKDRQFFARTMVQVQNRYKGATVHQVTYSPDHLLDLIRSPVKTHPAITPPLIFPMVIRDQYHAIICMPSSERQTTVAMVTTLTELPSWFDGDLLHQLLEKHGLPSNTIRYGRFAISAQECPHQNMPTVICAIYRWLHQARPACMPVDFDLPQHRQGSFSDLCQYFDSLW